MLTDSQGLNCEKCQCKNGIRQTEIEIRDIGYRSLGCPKLAITPFSWSMVEYHRYFKAGILPYQGGAADQPHYVMQAISIIDQRVTQNEVERHGKKTTR